MKQRYIFLGLFFGLLGGVGFYLLAPIFTDTVVDEPLPFASDTSDDSEVDPEMEKIRGELLELSIFHSDLKSQIEEIMVSENMDTQMLSSIVNMLQSEPQNSEMARELVSLILSEKKDIDDIRALEEQMMEGSESKTMTEPMPSTDEPVVIKSGDFEDVSSSYSGSGQAKIYELPDGSHFLRFEDFEVTNGPDLYVYLTKKSSVQTSDDVQQGFYSIARLKGNKGSQNYPIPDDINVEEYESVVIYCRAFSVLFAAASFS